MEGFTLLIVLLLGLSAAASGCGIHSFSAALASNPPLHMSPSAYSQAEVVEALEGLGATTRKFVSPQSTTFACVDARGGGLIGDRSNAVSTLETPGGDFAELAALIVSYHRVKNTTATDKSVKKIFSSFMTKIATKKRPFYIHTDGKVSYALEKYMNLTGEEGVVVVPDMQPKDKNSSAAWYKALALPAAQGCGHIRYMMQHPEEYDLNTRKEAAVPEHLFKAFLKYWWPTAPGSSQRAKILYPILQGTLGGGALAIVNNVGPDCADKEPDLAPFHGGSSMFLYQGNAVATFRSTVLIPFIKAYDRKIDSAAVMEALNALQAVQLGATLKLLSPLNKLPIFQVNITSYE